jgi:glycosyltransferase involved in cell wall biosynthesis
MAGQTSQLADLLRGEGALVELVQTNARYRPPAIGRVRGLRAFFRLVPFCVRLWRAFARNDIAHIMANSGWSWHLVAAPAIWIARFRAVPSIVNYRGGEAMLFLRRSARIVRATLARADALVVPSGFLQEVFAKHGISARVIPNVVDLARFRFSNAPALHAQRILVARHLEPIYGIDTALRAFGEVRRVVPNATMLVAGTGVALAELVRLRDELGLRDCVTFCGPLDRDEMAEEYRKACVVLNPSRADNMPNSVLEAMASGVPVVSTNVGGVPFIVNSGLNGILVPPDDAHAMACALTTLLHDRALARRLADAAFADVQRYTWGAVRESWAQVYSAARRPEKAAR